jgi:hypothetical protein
MKYPIEYNNFGGAAAAQQSPKKYNLLDSYYKETVQRYFNDKNKQRDHYIRDLNNLMSVNKLESLHRSYLEKFDMLRNGKPELIAQLRNPVISQELFGEKIKQLNEKIITISRLPKKITNENDRKTLISNSEEYHNIYVTLELALINSSEEVEVLFQKHASEISGRSDIAASLGFEGSVQVQGDQVARPRSDSSSSEYSNPDGDFM